MSTDFSKKLWTNDTTLTQNLSVVQAQLVVKQMNCDRTRLQGIAHFFTSQKHSANKKYLSIHSSLCCLFCGDEHPFTTGILKLFSWLCCDDSLVLNLFALE